MLICWNQKRFLLILFAFWLIYSIITSSWCSYKFQLRSFVPTMWHPNSSYCKTVFTSFYFFP